MLKNLPDEVRARTLDAVPNGTGKLELRTRVESNETELMLVPADGSTAPWAGAHRPKLARHDDLRQLTDERSAQASLDSCHRESIPPARPVCTTPMASPGWAMERRNRGRPRCNRVRQGQRSCLPRFSSGAGDLTMDSTSTHTTGLCVARTRSKCRRVTLRSSIERSRTSRRIAARRTRHQARLEATGSR